MTLLEALFAHFVVTPELASAIPGGVDLDYSQEPNPQKPYAVIEDAGGATEKTSTGDGPSNPTVRFWVFGDNEGQVTAAGRLWAAKIDATEEFDLGAGHLAYAADGTIPQTVTQQELMKDVQVAFQLSFDRNFQL